MISMTSVAWHLSLVGAGQASVDAGEDLQIEVAKKRVGKHVVISQGANEWFMLINVTPENAVIHRRERYQDRYMVDESETHDCPMTSDEVESRSPTMSTA
ncbi:MAG: hypothetical protein P0120_18960 [Nitrospira sp.]|nr:hypothetical protein [Nitrospira sp.]